MKKTMRVLFQKADLDTCLTALVLGVRQNDHVIQVRGDAVRKDLMDPETICIECGGSGLTDLRNFDHHDQGRTLPPACRQAIIAKSSPDQGLRRLVDYVCMVDEGIPISPAIPYPSLSSVFSGMLMTTPTPVASFQKGIGLLQNFLDLGLDPFATVPVNDSLRVYLQAKERNMTQHRADLHSLKKYKTVKGLTVGVLISSAVGGISSIYDQGADIAILFNPCHSDPPLAKFTIAGRNRNIYSLVAAFSDLEEGWGGKTEIIGSPRNGTILDLATVLKTVITSM